MAVSFSRTTRALGADRGPGTSIAMVVALLLIAAWMAWFFLARVTVYEVSRSAHVEVVSASREIALEQGGKLIANGLYIGRRVRAGEVLAELDSQPQRLRLAEAEARLAGYEARTKALRSQVAAAQDAQAGASQAGASAAAAARARAREAEVTSDFSRGLAQRQRADAAAGGLAPVEADKAEAEARRAAALGEARRYEQASAAGEALVRRADRAAEAARAGEGLSSAEAEHAAMIAEVEQLRYELDQRRIKAPVDGIVGDIVTLRLGAILPGGARIATVVPEGALHIVAAFNPATGIGRLAQGQVARLRLDGFSWAQYGDYPARVQHVAAEGHDNQLRVDLTMIPGANLAIPVRHGMTGQVEVATEQISPAIMVLRAIGRMLA